MASEYIALEVFHGGKATPPAPQVINVTATGDNVIRTALVAAAAAIQSRPYTVNIANGTYHEIQMTVPSWVTVQGASRAGVVIICDGLRTDVDPVSGQRYVDMAQSAKHTFWIASNSTVKSLTVQANDVKYVQHSDAGSVYTSRVEDCSFQHSNGNPVGVGLYANQKLYWTNCQFIYTGLEDVHGILLHNWNEQTAAGLCTLTSCESVGCPLAILTETGSEQSDLITLDQCTSPAAIDYTVNPAYWDGGEHAASELPYSLAVHVIGGTIPAPIVTYSETDRPNMATILTIE